jgi:hypothetical protein
MIKNKLQYLLPLFLLLVIFYPLINGSDVAWGDAPYFVGRAFTDLLAEPLAWINRGNALGGVNSLLWISPIMFLYGLLGSIGIQNNVILLVLFYIPAMFFGFIGTNLLTGLFKASARGKIIGSLFYILNTYFLLIIDGGQVGVALAYGLLPLMIWSILRIKRNSLSEILTAVFTVNLISIADPRFAVVGYSVVFLWLLISALQGKTLGISLRTLCLIVLVHFGISLYWIVPFIKLGSTNVAQLSDYKFTSLLHSLTLYQPHWPGNQFGKVVPPYFVFLFVPLVILLIGFKGKNRSTKVLIFLYLLFAFLSKGNNFPLGNIYTFFVSTPFGIAFRDSSKFYSASILIVSILFAKILTKYNKLSVGLIVFAMIVLMIPEAIMHKLNFVLKGKNYNESYYKVQTLISNDRESFKTLWIPDIYPAHWSTEDKPAIRGIELAENQIFSRLNTGTYDPFNFINRSDYKEWLDIAGIKYIVLNPNPRVILPTQDEFRTLKATENIISTESAYTKIFDEGDVLIYKTNKNKPKIYAIKTIVGVVGGDNIYKYLEGRIDKQGVVFFEDGIFDPRSLDGIATQSAVLTFNNKSEKDLTMSFLQKYFKEINPKTWSKYSKNDLSLWRYQLLIRGIDTKELNYGKGISLSTKVNEKESILLKQTESPSLIAIRLMGSSDSIAEVDINGKKVEWKPKVSGSFEWLTDGTGEKSVEVTISNKSGIVVLNTVALIPLSDYSKAEQLARNYMSSFKVFDPEKLSNFGSDWVNLDYLSSAVNRYSFKAPKDSYWVVLTDTYNKEWKLKRDTNYFDSTPFYSGINGFYIEPAWNNTEIVFKGQEYFRWGILGSTATILLLILGIVWKLTK